LNERYDILSTTHKDHRFIVVLDEVLDEVKIKLNGDNSVALTESLYQLGEVRGKTGDQIFIRDDSGQRVGTLKRNHLLTSIEGD
jgi:hypothetical protein